MLAPVKNTTPEHEAIVNHLSVESLGKLNHYESLLELSYEQAVSRLLDIYGQATVDYFSERSYTRFLNGEIKTMKSQKKISRTSEGLYCHHINEIEFANLCNLDYIKMQRVPFTSHTKDKLVYCDMIEHLILHLLIYKEKRNHLGIGGVNIMKEIYDYWFTYQVPVRAWEKTCFDKCYLEPDHRKQFFAKYQEILDSIEPDHEAIAQGVIDILLPPEQRAVFERLFGDWYGKL